MPIVTKSKYAQMCGCSPANITKHVKSGRLKDAIVLVKGRERIDSDKADKILKLNRDTAKVRNNGMNLEADKVLSGSMDEIRRKSAQAKLEQQQLDLAQRKKETLPRAETMAAIAAAGAGIREHLQARNRRLAEQASTMTDAREIKAMLDKDDRAMLEMISHDLMRRISPEGDGESAEPTIN